MCAYSSGCRCDKCKARHRDRMREYVAQRRQREPNYYPGKTTKLVPCAHCGQPLLKNFGTPMHKACRLDQERSLRRRQRALHVLEVAAQGQVTAMVWTQGPCGRCGAMFCTRGTHATRYCSAQCRSRSANSRRRARERDAFVAEVNPAKVFAADGYRCHLCGKLCDSTKSVPHPKAATVDHVVPLSRGGFHEPLNCRTAHFRCNYMKREHGGGEQLILLA